MIETGVYSVVNNALISPRELFNVLKKKINMRFQYGVKVPGPDFFPTKNTQGIFYCLWTVFSYQW